MKKVLLVEDDATMVALLKTLLKMEGYQVAALDSDADIVSSVIKANPDILLMDVHLLHFNGMDELAKLRATPGGESVRVLMTSGLDFKDQCLMRGANGFIQKPFMPDDLLDALRSVS
ncbi:MAG TPA: response regulator [Anaerolineales bacterium]|nr:response regulator [Anaerolineales bacterium]